MLGPSNLIGSGRNLHTFVPLPRSTSSASVTSHGGLPSHMVVNPEPHLRPTRPSVTLPALLASGPHGPAGLASSPSGPPTHDDLFHDPDRLRRQLDYLLFIPIPTQKLLRKNGRGPGILWQNPLQRYPPKKADVILKLILTLTLTWQLVLCARRHPHQVRARLNLIVSLLLPHP